jgi:hypothetical protein
MPLRMHRYSGSGHPHFITTSCYYWRALLGQRPVKNPERAASEIPAEAERLKPE